MGTVNGAGMWMDSLKWEFSLLEQVPLLSPVSWYNVLASAVSINSTWRWSGQRRRNEAIWLILVAAERQRLERGRVQICRLRPRHGAHGRPRGPRPGPENRLLSSRVRQAAASLRPLPLLSVSPLSKSHGRRPAARPQRHWAEAGAQSAREPSALAARGGAGAPRRGCGPQRGWRELQQQQLLQQLCAVCVLLLFILPCLWFSTTRPPQRPGKAGDQTARPQAGDGECVASAVTWGPGCLRPGSREEARRRAGTRLWTRLQLSLNPEDFARSLGALEAHSAPLSNSVTHCAPPCSCQQIIPHQPT